MQFMKASMFLTAEDKLRGDDAVAAILVLEDGRYVMQLRDDIPNIFYPDHWGCFGGAVNVGEEPLQALHRELEEELELKISGASFFSRFDFEIKAWPKKVFRSYYEVPVTAEVFSRMVLHEGAEVRAFTGMDILQQPHVTPYDAFAIWLHFKGSRFS
jgi:8-oxo-dGTP pyrophosphatase MutT (NUDIX family)